MADETSNDTSCVMDQATIPEEKLSQECSPTDVATADELFDSFMEIANNPELNNEQADMQNGTTGDAVAASDTSISQLKESSAEEQRDTASDRTQDQDETNTSNRRSVSQLRDIFNSSSGELQTDIQNRIDDQGSETDKKSTPNGTPDQGESTAGESSNLVVSQVKDANSSADADKLKVDSAESVSATGQLSSDDNPVQTDTETPVEDSENDSPSRVSDESKSDEICATTDSEQPSSHATNAEVGTKELSRGTEKSSDSSETPMTENKELSTERGADSIVADEQQEVLREKDPTTSEKDVAKRLSKAMEDLAGLEQQLSDAMSEMQRTNSKKAFADKDIEKEQNAENQADGLVADHTNVAETMETKVENELSDDKIVTIEGGDAPAAQESDVNTTVCKADVDLNEVSMDSNNKETLVENMDKDEKDSDSKKTDVDVVEAQESKMENSESGESDKPAGKEDIKVESDMGAGETPNVQVKETDSELPDDTVKSQTETNTEESKNDEEALANQSDSMDELDAEVAMVTMSIPDIEITTDESGISENKSLDSMDTEGSSNSPPASPAFSDEGVDSDTPSDYGDDDDNGTFEGEEPSRRKSWLLEIDRDRLSSDSSTVSEKDFKENYGKGDNADGKPPKDDYIRGHLLKMGGTGLTPKNWRKRWFVLRGDNCLYYYKQSKDKVPCGVIILANYSVSKAPEINKNHCFKITKGGARTYYMCAGSDSDMKKWIMAMMDAIKESSGSSNPFNLLEGNVHNVSIPALSIRDPDCHGYLYKQGHNIKTWRRRYFVLKNGFLYYYSDMSNTVALGVAKLLHYTIQVGEQTGKKFCFSAVSSDPSSRTYYFAAESEMDRNRWLSRLEDSIKKG